MKDSKERFKGGIQRRDSKEGFKGGIQRRDSKEGFKGNLGSLYIKKMYAIIINIMMYGRRNRNHETDS